MSLRPDVALVVLAVLFSALLFHTLWGRSWRGLAVALIASSFGFGLGLWIGRWLGWASHVPEPQAMAAGVLGSWLTMAVARRRVA